MLDRELVTRKIKSITDNAWRQDSGQTTTLNGMIEYIIREVFMDVFDPMLQDLNRRLEQFEDYEQYFPRLEEIESKLKELENGKDGQLQKPQRSAKASAKDRNGSAAEAR